MNEIHGESILVGVSARFELARVRVIGIRLYHEWYLSQISLTNHAICLHHHLMRNSVMQHRLFSWVELFRFAAEQIGFKVPVFRPPGPDIELGRCTFLTVVFWLCEFSFSSWIFWIVKFGNLSAICFVTLILVNRVTFSHVGWNTSALRQSNFSGSSSINAGILHLS